MKASREDGYTDSDAELAACVVANIENGVTTRSLPILEVALAQAKALAARLLAVAP